MAISAARKARLHHRIQKTARLLQRTADAEFGMAGLTTPQLAMLAIVRQRPASQRELAHQLGLNEPAVASMVSRLVSQALLARDDDPDDARAWRLTLTREGAARLDAVDPAMRRINARIESVLSADEIAQLAEWLDRLMVEFGPEAAGG